MAEPQTTTEYNPLGKLLGVLALLAAGLYFTGWTYRWTYFSFFQLEVTTLNLPGESFYLAAFQTFFGEPLAFLRTILVLGVTVLAILVTLHWGQTFWANAVRPYIVDKIRYCRGAKLAPSDRLGYYSHASPLLSMKPRQRFLTFSPLC